MARKHKPEEIIGKLREAEIVLAQKSRAYLYGQVGGVSLMRNALRWSDAPLPALHLRP